jgi:hypothetical protein
LKNLTKHIANLVNFGTHFGAICVALSRSCALFKRPVFQNLRGAPPRVILDVEMEQKGAKRSQHGDQKGAKMMQNYLPTHNQSTQVLFTAIMPLRHYFSDEFKNHLARDVDEFRTPFQYFVNT